MAAPTLPPGLDHGVVSTAVQSRRANAGLLSNAGSFYLPVGSHIDPTAVRGYPIDLRIKAEHPVWPSPDPDVPGRLVVGSAQYGLACYEHWLSGAGEVWLAAATDCGRYLLGTQEPDGSWLHHRPLAHTFDVQAPWRSAMAQGEVASLLVRLHLETGEERFAEAALNALGPLYKPVRNGGVRAELGGGAWFEEYPTQPASYVLNGGIFALWGLRDVAVGLSDDQAARTFREGIEVLATNLKRFDTGWWSLYSLFRHPVLNVASSFYHSLHICQLQAMSVFEPRPELTSTLERWQAYAGSAVSSRHAFVRKVGFRLLVPRNRLIAQPAARFWAAKSRPHVSCG